MGEDSIENLAKGHRCWGRINLLTEGDSLITSDAPAAVPVFIRPADKVHIGSSIFRFFVKPQGCAGASAQQLLLI